jgi:flagellar L-ring protein precursor FlgH
MSRKLLFVILMVLVFILVGCATTTTKLPPKPPKYVYKEEALRPMSKNSLWIDRASLFEDNKARRLNDLVTIKIVENISGSGDAETDVSRESGIDVGITDLFGIPLDLNLSNLYGKGHTFSPTVKSSFENSFKGSGKTKRNSKLIGTITAKVIEVMPNGNLILEGRKDIVINNERQILILRGMVRPEDIDSDNTVLSSRLTDTEIYYVGKGIIQASQSPGWLGTILNKIWPF